MTVEERKPQDWQLGLSSLAERHWADHGQVLLLTDMPSKLEADGIDVKAMLDGKKLLAFLLADASEVVATVQHPERPLVWGIAPLMLSDLDEVPFPLAKGKKHSAADGQFWDKGNDNNIFPSKLNAVNLSNSNAVSKDPSGSQDIKEEKVYATIRHPSIEAAANGRFYFQSIQKAKARLDSIRKHFVFAKADPGETEDDRIIWIKGFGLTKEDESQGFVGHYARFVIKKRASGGFTMIADRVDIPINRHPQKKRLNSKHPNWGHPFMRKVKKGGRMVVFPTEGAAQAALDGFHEEFPEATIPGKLQLFAHIYVKEGGDIGAGHIQKIVIAAQEDIDGNYKIFWRPNYRGIQAAIDLRDDPDSPKIEPSANGALKIIDEAVDDLFGDSRS